MIPLGFKRDTLRDEVYNLLLHRLISGKYAPGSPLQIGLLAKELDISPTPVREALVKLENTSLISRTALKGYRVSEPLSNKQISQLIDMRLVLENAAAERAAKNAKKLFPDLQIAHEEHARQADKVNKLAEAGKLAVENLIPYFSADWNFHHTILQYCENSYIEKTADNLSFNIHRIRQDLLTKSSDALIAVAEHQQILDAFKDGDVEQIRNAMTNHLLNVLNRSTASNKIIKSTVVIDN
ncbi:GntR family transcriptional regulator [Arcanobacterium urinimassiliense]|uniref:GntR family transcriptional regulator n=1 Tax=Arcanobacterium urinimassiliense TaxID=1871014 RepID=UPI00093F924F|nr:GntR family transcriptional regulator [Arcanobacterium urinimassiliense]